MIFLEFNPPKGAIRKPPTVVVQQLKPKLELSPKSASGSSNDFWFCLPLTSTDHT